MVGLSWGGGAQLGGTRKRWGAGTLVLRAVCAAGQRLEGSEGRRFACSPPGLLGSKVPPPGPAPWCFRPPLREDPDLSEGSRLIPHWLQS